MSRKRERGEKGKQKERHRYKGRRREAKVRERMANWIRREGYKKVEELGTEEMIKEGRESAQEGERRKVSGRKAREGIRVTLFVLTFYELLTGRMYMIHC